MARQVFFPNIQNTIGDKKIKKDLLLRTGRLSSLSEEDSLLLVERYKVQCVYDFRSKEEALSLPDILPGNSKYLLLSLSFSNEAAQPDFKVESERDLTRLLLENADHPMVQGICEKIYDKIFLDESSQEVYRRFFENLLMLDPEDGAILWHCSQGKDRAGCASAMLLTALGADRELIMADFELSKDYYAPDLEHIEVKTENQRKVISTLLSVNPETFQMTLDKIDMIYGSFSNYLTECIGMTPEKRAILCDRYLE